MYKVFRMNTMFRGAVASMIYGKALVADSNHNNMAAVTLMSTDVDRIGMETHIAAMQCLSLGRYVVCRALLM
jgi:hypothetical protein